MKNPQPIDPLDNNIKPETSNAFTRRKFIKMTGTGLALLSFPGISAAKVKTKISASNPRIVWVLLRGALDSLHTVIPTFEPEYKALRPKLSGSFKTPLLPLEKGFELHPSLINLHQWYQAKQLLPIVAVSSGYDRRSHFDAQDFLESGKGEIDQDSGWLARAIDVKNKRALAVARSTPISLRSSEQVNTWFPSNLASADDDIYQALGKLYQDDELLSANLEKGLEIRGLVGPKTAKNKKQQGQFVELNKACAKLMTADKNLACAMLELGGWDTHNNQANRLDKKLSELDNGLAQLKAGLSEEWQNTVVIIGTEFGRTAKENGTGGTDHGTASALFVAGGAIAGGKIAGKWPGLSNAALFEQRDLMPTTNSFSWIANILVQHWQFSQQELLQVFPHVKTYNENLVLS